MNEFYSRGLRRLVPFFFLNEHEEHWCGSLMVIVSSREKAPAWMLHGNRERLSVFRPWFWVYSRLEESEVGRFWWLLHSKPIGLIWIPSEWASVSQSLVIGLGNGRLHCFNCWKESTLSVAWEPLGFTLSVPGCVAAVWCIGRILVASLAVFPSRLRTSLFQLSRQPGFTCGVRWPSHWC